MNRQRLTRHSVLPSVLHFRFGPIGLQLSHVLLDNDVIIGLGDTAAIFVVIDPFGSIAVNHLLAEQFHRLVRHLAFAGALFHVVQKRDRVLGAASLKNNNRNNNNSAAQ